MANTSNTASEDTTLVDVFPADGDSLESSFSGTYSIGSITIDFSNATTSYALDADSMAFYVTSSVNPGDGSELVMDSVPASWTNLMSTASAQDTTLTLDVSGYEDMTAFYFDLGTLSGNENIAITIEVDTDGNEAGDLYRNRYYEYSNNQATYVASNSVDVHVVQRTISGLAWLDTDKDGIQEDNETLLSDVTVSLYRTTASTYDTDGSSTLQVDGTDLYPAYTINGTVVSSASTDDDGVYLFTDLESGTYYVVFSGSAITAYGVTEVDVGTDDSVDSDAAAVLSSTGATIESAYISSLDLPELADMDRYLFSSANNDAGFIESSLIIQKAAEETDEPLANAVFVLKSSSGTYLTFDSNVYTGSTTTISEGCYLTTGTDGTVTAYRIPAGTYTVIEYEAPTGYACSSGDVSVTITDPGADADTGIIYNVKATGSLIVTKEIEGAIASTVTQEFTFNLAGTSDLGDTVDETRTITGAGTVEFNDIPVGTYTLTETSVAGWTSSLGEGQTVTITYSETSTAAEITVTNTRNTGTLTVVKTVNGDDWESLDDEDKTITFNLSGTSETGEEVDITISRTGPGELVFEDVPTGTYELTEVSTISGYSLLSSPVTITLPTLLSQSEADELGWDTSEASYDSSTGLYAFYEITCTISNGSVLDMPSTGGTGTATIYGVVGGLLSITGIVFAAVILEQKRRKAAIESKLS